MVKSWSWVSVTPANTSANHSAELTRALKTRPAIAMSITAATFEVSVIGFSFPVAIAHPSSLWQHSAFGPLPCPAGASAVSLRLAGGCPGATRRCIVRGDATRTPVHRRDLMAEVDGA